MKSKRHVNEFHSSGRNSTVGGGEAEPTTPLVRHLSRFRHRRRRPPARNRGVIVTLRYTRKLLAAPAIDLRIISCLAAAARNSIIDVFSVLKHIDFLHLGHEGERSLRRIPREMPPINASINAARVGERALKARGRDTRRSAPTPLATFISRRISSRRRRRRVSSPSVRTHSLARVHPFRIRTYGAVNCATVIRSDTFNGGREREKHYLLGAMGSKALQSATKKCTKKNDIFLSARK